MKSDKVRAVELSCLFRFGDTADNEFYLNTYRSRSLLLSALNRLGYRSRGSRRNVQAALNAMRTQQFTGSNVCNINYMLWLCSQLMSGAVPDFENVSSCRATGCTGLMRLLHFMCSQRYALGISLYVVFRLYIQLRRSQQCMMF